MDWFSLLTLFLIVFVPLSSLWVYFDARRIGGDLANEPSVFGTSPALWALGSLMMWGLVFPTYYFRRNEFKRRVAEYRNLPEEYKWK